MRARVASFGDLNLDIIMFFPDLESALLRDVSYVAERAVYSPGGVGGNVAVALSRLGAASSVIGAVGADPIGGLLVEDLKREGVQAGGVRVVQGEPTGVMAIVVRPGGKRTILGHRGANRLNVLSEEAARGVAAASDCVFASGFASKNADGGRSIKLLLSAARREGATTALDLGGFGRDGARLVPELRGHVSYAFLNEDELEELTGSSGASSAEALFKALDAEALFLKMGERGALAITRKGKARVPAFRVKAVDTTGCGDAFDAGVIYSLLSGADAEYAAIFGSAMGAYKAQGVGARHLPRSAREVEELVEELSGRAT